MPSFYAPREPQYKGQPLSYWASRYADTFYSSEFPGEGFRRIREVRKDFADAVAAAGTTVSAAYFVEQLIWEPPWWKRWGSRLGLKWQWLRYDLSEFGRRSTIGQGGFLILGTNGLVALPQIGELVNNPRYCQRVTPVLSKLGPASFPVVTNALLSTNAMVQLEVLKHIPEFRGHADALQPILLKLAQHHDPQVRATALGMFCSSGTSGTVAVPVLVEALSDTPSRWSSKR